MKKLIALLLALTCVFMLVACGGGDNTGDETPDYEDLKAFTDAVAATAPTSATITTSLASTVLGVTLEGEYAVVYNEDGTATVTYTYDKLNAIDENSTADELISQVNGTVTIAQDGTVSGAINGDVAAAAGIKLNLVGEKLGEYTVASGVLTATVLAADTETVLGTAIGADVTLTVSIGEGKIATYTISYTTAQGPAEIVCVYFN